MQREGAMGRGKRIGGALCFGLRDLSSFADRSTPLSLIVSFRILSFTSAIDFFAKSIKVRSKDNLLFDCFSSKMCVSVTVIEHYELTTSSPRFLYRVRVRSIKLGKYNIWSARFERLAGGG